MKNKHCNGVTLFEVDTWEELKNLLDNNFHLKSDYAFRGQREEEWDLSPKITRILNDKTKFKVDKLWNIEGFIERHLKLFRRNILGRRGANPPKLSDNELWSLGQHHGLVTPLLDWTRSPYAAVYFAFKELKTTETRRAIWALDIMMLRIASERYVEYLKEHSDKDKNQYGLKRGIIEIIEPEHDENTRLINQSGLFTKIPYRSKLEDWASKILKNGLIKITVPESERNKILRSLDLMNINESTLFPDISGAAAYTNYLLEELTPGSKSAKPRTKGISIGFDLDDLPD